MQHDVVIAGAGPAGAATALRLARANIPVTLIDRSSFPRRKVCGEYLGAGALRELDDLGVLPMVQSAGAPLHGIRISASGAHLTMPFPSPALSVTRERLDALLVDAAVNAGARFLRARVQDVMRNRHGRASGVVVRDESGERRELEARFVVGADGIGSVVARKLSLTRRRSPKPRFALGGHYRRSTEDLAYVEMTVERHSYLAINPLGNGIANVMAVVDRAAVEAWTKKFEVSDASRVGARVAVGPLHHAVRCAATDGALLVGDAAGFLDPFTGQGVFLALRGAARAAHAIAQAYGDYAAEKEALQRYEAARVGELTARGRLATLVGLLVRVPPLAKRAADRLQRSPQLSGGLLDALMGASDPQPMLRPGTLRRLIA